MAGFLGRPCLKAGDRVVLRGEECILTGPSDYDQCPWVVQRRDGVLENCAADELTLLTGHSEGEQKAPGAKDDRGKARVDLLPPGALAAVANAWMRLGPSVHALHEQRTLEAVAASAAWYRAYRKGGADNARPELLSAAVRVLRLSSDDLGEALHSVTRVLEYGAYKAPRPDGSCGYGEYNWAGVENPMVRYYAAAQRHLFQALRKAQDESGEPHVVHAACCLLFVLELSQPGGAA